MTLGIVLMLVTGFTSCSGNSTDNENSMDTKQLTEMFRHRRSVRQYDKSPVAEEKLNAILEAGMTAPTGDNTHEVECIVVQERATLDSLSHIRKVGTRMLETAGAAIIVVANPDKTDLWMEDASISMAYMHLAADALGLGSCWIQMWNRDAADGQDLEPVMRERFGIPSYMRILAILSLGNTNSHPAPHDADYMNWNKVHKERY